MAAGTNSLVGSCYAVCAVDRVVEFIWTEVPTIDGVAMTSVVERVYGGGPEQLGMLIMIDPKAGRPVPASVRDALTHAMKHYAPKIRG